MSGERNRKQLLFLAIIADPGYVTKRLASGPFVATKTCQLSKERVLNRYYLQNLDESMTALALCHYALVHVLVDIFIYQIKGEMLTCQQLSLQIRATSTACFHYLLSQASKWLFIPQQCEELNPGCQTRVALANLK